jgi:hypothetical protein
VHCVGIVHCARSEHNIAVYNMSTTLSFTNHYLLATVTSSIPAGGDFLPRLKEDMDLLMKNELLPMGRDGVLAGGR